MPNNVKSCKTINCNEKAQTVNFSVFALWCRPSQELFLKTWKTGETKMRITQHHFQILWPIQGGTMWKSVSSAFRKCITYGGNVVFICSYWPPKFIQFSIFFNSKTEKILCFFHPVNRQIFGDTSFLSVSYKVYLEL